MKLQLLLLFCIFVCKSFAQNLVTNVTITMPQTVPANTADWATTVPPIMIAAKGAMQNGSLNGNVLESVMLVTIKRDGAKVCGMYTKSTAPNAGFNTAVKTWSGSSVVSMLGQDCSLQSGNYELCVQFFRIAPIAEISTEVCKPFKVAGAANPSNPNNPTVSTEKFTPPTNMVPVNGATLKGEDAKKPLTFRWTPIIPKPQQPVLYRLRMWQIMQQRPPAEAMKISKPLIEKEISNQTQFVKPNLLGDIELIDNRADLVWNVQAVDEKGTVLGSSEPTVFGVSGTAQAVQQLCNFDPSLDTIYCTGVCANGKMKYRVKLKLKNNATAPLNFNNTMNYTIQMGVTAYASANVSIPNNLVLGWNPSSGGYGTQNTSITVTPISTPPATIAASSTVYQEYDVCADASTPMPLTLKVFTSMNSTTGAPGNCSDDVIINSLPSCRCTTCDQIAFELGQETSSFNPGPKPWMLGDNNHLYLTQPLIVGPTSIKVLQVKTEVVDFYWYTENEDCKKCNNNTYYWGNLIRGTSNATGFNPSGTPGTDEAGVPLPNSHEMQFMSTATTGTAFNGNLNLQLTVPPQTTLKCCEDCFRFCIRYTIVFKENGVCKVCTKVKCYEVKRKHRPIMMQPWPPLNACGEQTLIDFQPIDIKKISN